MCLIAFATFESSFGVGSETDESVLRAYEQRMNGKVDDAKELLEQALSENSANAEAHYELARTTLHMALGKPRELESLMKEAQQSIEQAVENDPDNFIYRLFSGHLAFFPAYISLQKGLPGVKEDFAKVCGAYESALKVKPSSLPVMLYLVELYAVFGEDQGGDRSRAEHYAKQLEEINEVFGAKARSMLVPPDADQIAYWENVLRSHPKDAEVLEELGKAYLRANRVDEAVDCIEEAVLLDSGRTILHLDLGRYHMMSAMRAMRAQDTDRLESSLRSAEEPVTRYIESDPLIPMRAFATGILARLNMAGDKTKGDELIRRAQEMDPYFSKAFGSPTPDLFLPPGEISQNHRYLLRPF